VNETALERAVDVLGPLEGRIMRALWSGQVAEPFVVKSVQAQMPELAYTTVMTTLNRLAEKGLLTVRPVRGQKAHEYRVAGTPEQFLAMASGMQVDRVLAQYGDAALAAFAARLEHLGPEQRQRLRELLER
jgi:predicted transcriptional regulator